VRSQTYCRLLVLPKASFDRFMRANPDVRSKIDETAKQRFLANKTEAAAPL
jgi:CRP-like cAMP-binding protein